MPLDTGLPAGMTNLLRLMGNQKNKFRGYCGLKYGSKVEARQILVTLNSAELIFRPLEHRLGRPIANRFHDG